MRNVATDTRARVDLQLWDNATWSDAFQFGDPDDTSWNFTDKDFFLSVKASSEDDTALLEIATGSGIVVDDAALRVLHFHVPADVLQAALPPGNYIYDLIMHDTVQGVGTVLMGGKIHVKHGITTDEDV